MLLLILAAPLIPQVVHVLSVTTASHYSAVKRNVSQLQTLNFLLQSQE